MREPGAYVLNAWRGELCETALVCRPRRSSALHCFKRIANVAQPSWLWGQWASCPLILLFFAKFFVSVGVFFVPLFDWLRPIFGWHRNHYDRLGHIVQGFVPALVTREVFVRLQVLKRARWQPFLIVCVCLAISAFYELIEWWTALASGDAAISF